MVWLILKSISTSPPSRAFPTLPYTSYSSCCPRTKKWLPVTRTLAGSCLDVAIAQSPFWSTPYTAAPLAPHSLLPSHFLFPYSVLFFLEYLSPPERSFCLILESKLHKGRNFGHCCVSSAPSAEPGTWEVFC